MTATPRAVELVETAALAAADKLADGIIAYDVSDQLVITDAFLLCSASNDRQVRAIVDEIELSFNPKGEPATSSPTVVSVEDAGGVAGAAAGGVMTSRPRPLAP